MNDFTLTQSDKHSPLWARLKKHLDAELAIAREQNDSPLDADKTAALRGRIRLAKELIALGD